MMTHEHRMTSLITDALATAPDFRPFAVLDESLDCIRVITRDCSVKEIRINELITLLEANHTASSRPEYVGFTIKGVAHLCETHGIPLIAPLKLAVLLDAILASSKPNAQVTVKTVVRPIVEQSDLQDVEMAA